MIFTGLCIALCIVVPMAFHAIPNAGSIFAPMHLPVYICGFVCGWQYGLVCGLAGPLLSSLLTGMPPAAILPAMMVELAVYGLVSAIMLKVVNTKKIAADLYISLIVAMLSGRVIAAIAKALIFARGQASIEMLATSYFVTCLPGIAIQLAIIPALYLALEKARVIDKKYVKKADE